MVLIGVLKLLQTAFLLLAAIVTLRIAHGPSLENFTRWTQEFRIDPNNRHVHALLTRLLRVNVKSLRYFAVGTFIYATIFAIEGFGLVLRKLWAEYFTVVSTGLLIPLEVYEVFHHVHSPREIAKIVLLILNVAIVVYLVARLMAQRRSKA